MFHPKSCDCTQCRAYRKHKATNRFAAKIALRGGAVSKGQFLAPWEPYCDDPVIINRIVTSRQAVDDLVPLELGAQVPCRKCQKCLLFRAMKWQERIVTELIRAKRTWWLTLTFDPIHLAGILLEAKSSERKKIEKAAYWHVQRFYKRLRKKGTDSDISRSTKKAINMAGRTTTCFYMNRDPSRS